MGGLLVVNLRGTVNTRKDVKATLEQLHLYRRFAATLVPDSRSYLGMLRKAKEHLSWFPVDAKMVGQLLSKRATSAGGRPLLDEVVKQAGFGSIPELAAKLAEGAIPLSRLDGVKPFFRLAPPRGGFKLSSKKLYSEGGVLGKNPRLPDLVSRMI